MKNQDKPAIDPAETRPNTVILTHGENVPKPNPSSQVTWAPGKPPGGTPISKPLPARAEQ